MGKVSGEKVKYLHKYTRDQETVICCPYIGCCGLNTYLKKFSYAEQTQNI